MRLLPLLLAAGCAHAATAAPRAPAPPPPRKSITLTYLGVAGWKLTDGKTVILVDPYFSRPSPDAPPVSDEQAVAAHVNGPADLILVEHSHFDHVLDVPAVARLTGAQVVGTEATARIARAGGVPEDHIIPVKGGEDYEFDGFSVRVIPSLHSAVSDKHAMPPMPAGYEEGGTLAYLVRLGGHEVLFVGSANYIERELEGLRPDVAVVATGAREQIHDYTCRLMRALGAPPLVLPDHFDDWHHAPAPISEDTKADLAAFADEVHACAPTTRVTVPEHFVDITIP